MAFNDTIDRYPASYYIYSAMYWRGRGYEKLGNKDEAIATFLQLGKASPYSYYGNIAKLRAAYLENPLEKEYIDEKIYRLAESQHSAISNHKYPPLDSIEVKPALSKVKELIILGPYKEARREAAA